MSGRTIRGRRAAHVAEFLESRQLLSVAEPNNTFATATTSSDITQFYGTTNYSNTDSVSSTADTDDYYKFFTLYGASHLYAALDGLSADADLYVYGQNQNLLASSRLGGSASETINVDLPANQYYYVRVNAFSGATNYSLYLYNDYAGATMATARDAGVSWGQSSDKVWAFGDLSQIDYMDYRDNVDYFKYQLEAPGTITARVTGGDTLTGTVQLLDSTGAVLATRSGTFSSGFNFPAMSEPAGTYYLKMTQSSGAAQTNVRFVSDYAGDTTATARDLGDLTNSTREDNDMVGSAAVTDVVSYSDPTDLYKFTLDKTAPVFANLTIAQGLKPPTFDANLGLAQDTNGDGFIESGEILDQSNNDSGTGNDSLSSTLKAGTYYVVVVADGAYTSYTLDLNSDLDGVPASANSLTAAINLGSLSGESFSSGGLDGFNGDSSDFYKFTLTAPGTFLATATVNPAYSRSSTLLNLQLLQDKNGNGLFDTTDTIGTAATGTLQSATLPAGTYYLRVGNGALQQAYDLRVVSDYAGDVNAPRSMATISSTTPPAQTFQDYVEEDFGATSDVNDAYKFVLPATYTATLKTTGVAGEDLALQLVDDFNNNGVIDSGDVIAASDVLDSPNETIVKTLAAGTYYVRVHGVNGGTNYTLTAAFAGTTTPTPTPTATKLTGTTIGTAGSFGGSGKTIAKATDGNLTTYFDGPTPNGDYVGLDLGSAKTITGVAYASRSGDASRMNGGVFQASNSATFATGDVTLYTIGATANPSSTALTTQSIGVAGTYRYVRYVAPNGSYGDVSEVQFFGPAPATPTLTKFTGTAIGTAGSFGGSGNTIAKALDGSTATYFDGPTADGDWVGLDLGTAKVVKQVIFTPRAGYGSRMAGGKIQVSNSATFATGVVTLATIATAPTGTTTLALTNSTAYRYVRYLAPDGSYGDVAELEFDG